MTADPRELRNLAVENPDQLQQLDGELTAWEERMQQRLADAVTLDEQERRALHGLGYASQTERAGNVQPPWRDVKDMLPYYYKLNDAVSMMEAGRYDLAEPVLREVLAADEEYFMAHGELGKCLLRLHQVSESLPHLRRCIELDPGAVRVRALLGGALFLTGDYPAAEEELRASIRHSPDLLDAHYNLGLTLEKLRRPDEAAEHYRNCLEILPHYRPARQRLEALEEAGTPK